MKRIAQYLASTTFKTIDKIRVALDRVDFRRINRELKNLNSKDVLTASRAKAYLDKYRDDLLLIHKFRNSQVNGQDLNLTETIKKLLNKAYDVFGKF